MIQNSTDTVQLMNAVSITGNIIPKLWYQRLTYTNKRGTRPHLLAINVLSEIVYWYKPKIVISEETGKVISHDNRFKADKLQKNYKQLAELFGVSYKLAREAVLFLVEKNMITTELRNIPVSGTVLQNVMFIEPVPENIDIVSNSSDYPIGILPITEMDKRRSPNSSTTDYPIGQKGITQLDSTYTKTTSKTTSESNTSINSDEITELLNHFNSVTGKKVYVTGDRAKRNRTLISSCLKKKFTKEEIKSVIDLKTFEWSWNPDMVQYLQISTIFRPSNFNKYIQHVEELKSDKKKAKQFVQQINKKKISNGITEKGKSTSSVKDFYSQKS